jgi:hypothetical protein
MSDLELLFLVLAALYAWECTGWLRRGSVAFVTWLSGHWRVRQPGSLLGNQRGGLIFLPPLPPLGGILTGTQLPLSISPDAVLAFVSSSINPGWRPPQTGKLFRFDEIRTVEARGKNVLVNGGVLAHVGSPTFAGWLSRELRQLAKTSAAKREQAIKELVRGCFDHRAIESRWQEFQKRTAWIQTLANCVLIHLFLLSPLVLHRWGLRQSWPGLLAGLLALTTATALLFRRAHKHFYPEAGEDRFTHFLTILLAPATTARANDILSRPLLENFHPLAIAKRFCSEKDFREFARQTLREIYHPALPLCPGNDVLAQATERYARALLRTTIEAFLAENGVAPETLLTPPAPSDESCRIYCPRCLAQFTITTGVCADCGGLELAPLDRPKPTPDLTPAKT